MTFGEDIVPTKLLSIREKYDDATPLNVKFNILQDEACSLGSDREIFERYISYLEFRYNQKEHNPVFIWEAIRLSYARLADEFLIKAVGSRGQFYSLSNVEQAELRISATKNFRDLNLALPDWCVSYLVTSASTISITSDYIDISKWLQSNRAAPEAVRKMLGLRPTLTNDQAANRLSALLGFTRQGWNSFDARRRERVALNVEQAFKDIILYTVSANEAYAKIGEALNMDDRAVRRLISTGRRLVRELESFIRPKLQKPSDEVSPLRR